jgi:SAM-dependent methyltransferase
VKLSLLVSPEAKAAYFKDYLAVTGCELIQVMGISDFEVRHIGALDFIELEAEEPQLEQLARLSFVQGIFRQENKLLSPLAILPAFQLHEDFVFGSKYRGKTNERLTQLLINVGLSVVDARQGNQIKLLDPMCGRGTSLLWGMRYGLNGRGIEQDPKALAEIRQNVKKWTRLHRVRHQMNEGFIGKANKQQRGKFLEFTADDTNIKIISGDAREAPALLKGEKFHLLVSDLPYGVQHVTTAGTRNPLQVLEECAEGWSESLKPGGALVLAFNSYLPRRDELLDLYRQYRLEPVEFSAPHRMSESIVRDVVVLRK